MSDVALDRPSYLPAAVSDRGPSLVTGLGLILGFIAIWYLVDLRQASLFAIGGGLGAALYHGAFGFTGGWRRMVVEKRGRGMRAQMLMIGTIERVEPDPEQPLRPQIVVRPTFEDLRRLPEVTLRIPDTGDQGDRP